MTIGKRMKAQLAKVPLGKQYPLDEAITVLKGTASAKFDESVDVAINLGIDSKKSEQNVRGSAVLPRGSGKTVRVAVFAEGAQAEAAKKAGADIVGFQDLADSIKAGKMDFDVVIADPGAMRIVGQLGQILGPRGLMPNPKVGTVTPQIAKAVENAKAGQVQFRIDKAGIIHCAIGKASFGADALKENLTALLAAVNKSKPPTSKGVYLKKLTLSTTMGPGVRVDTASLPV
jgi:large subunit ribosomal protein L1